MNLSKAVLATECDVGIEQLSRDSFAVADLSVNRLWHTHSVDTGPIRLPAGDRPGYAAELRSVLRLGGKFLLRASLRSAGVANDNRRGRHPRDLR